MVAAFKHGVFHGPQQHFDRLVTKAYVWAPYGAPQWFTFDLCDIHSHVLPAGYRNAAMADGRDPVFIWQIRHGTGGRPRMNVGWTGVSPEGTVFLEGHPHFSPQTVDARRLRAAVGGW